MKPCWGARRGSVVGGHQGRRQAAFGQPGLLGRAARTRAPPGGRFAVSLQTGGLAQDMLSATGMLGRERTGTAHHAACPQPIVGGANPPILRPLWRDKLADYRCTRGIRETGTRDARNRPVSCSPKPGARTPSIMAATVADSARCTAGEGRCACCAGVERAPVAACLCAPRAACCSLQPSPSLQRAPAREPLARRRAGCDGCSA